MDSIGFLCVCMPCALCIASVFLFPKFVFPFLVFVLLRVLYYSILSEPNNMVLSCNLPSHDKGPHMHGKRLPNATSIKLKMKQWKSISKSWVSPKNRLSERWNFLKFCFSSSSWWLTMCLYNLKLRRTYTEKPHLKLTNSNVRLDLCTVLLMKMMRIIDEEITRPNLPSLTAFQFKCSMYNIYCLAAAAGSNIYIVSNQKKNIVRINKIERENRT